MLVWSFRSRRVHHMSLCWHGGNDPLLHSLFAVVVLRATNGVDDGRPTLGVWSDVPWAFFAATT